MTYYTDKVYGGKFTYAEMIQDAKENYDLGDPTHAMTEREIIEENYRIIAEEEND